MTPFDQEVLATRKWFDSPRFATTTRLYSARQVVEQRGTITNDHTVARDAAEAHVDLRQPAWRAVRDGVLFRFATAAFGQVMIAAQQRDFREVVEHHGLVEGIRVAAQRAQERYFRGAQVRLRKLEQPFVVVPASPVRVRQIMPGMARFLQESESLVELLPLARRH